MAQQYTPRASAAIALSIISFLLGCGDDRPREYVPVFVDVSDGAAGSSSEEPWQTAVVKSEPMLPPFSTELDTLVSQTVRWASIDVRVVGARVVRGLSGPISGSYNALSAFGVEAADLAPNQIYVELDLELQNKGATEGDLSARGTWDLVLEDGRRLTSVDTLGVTILPSDDATTSLHYEVEPMVDLTGAKLVLNGSDRESHEPEELPLDQPYEQKFPRRIGSLVGQTVNFVADSDTASVHFDEAAYDINYAREGRADRGKRIVWLNLAFTATQRYGGYSAGDLRIVVDGRASNPVDYENDTIAEGITKVFSVAFEIDAGVTRFEIMVPDGSAEGQRFPVDVADTVLATDIE